MLKTLLKPRSQNKICKGNLVYISNNCPVLEVINVVESKGKLFAACKSWLEQKYFGTFETKYLIKYEEE
jgi:hypothetical protein